MSESAFTVKFGEGDVPNFTLVAPVKPDPLMSTSYPPAGEPVFGVTPFTAGAVT